MVILLKKVIEQLSMLGLRDLSPLLSDILFQLFPMLNKFLIVSSLCWLYCPLSKPTVVKVRIMISCYWHSESCSWLHQSTLRRMPELLFLKQFPIWSIVDSVLYRRQASFSMYLNWRFVFNIFRASNYFRCNYRFLFSQKTLLSLKYNKGFTALNGWL